MAFWARVQQLPLDTLRSIYGTNFPMEVRHVLADWIEGQPWMDLDENNPTHEGYASVVLRDLLKMLEEKVRSLPTSDFLLKVKLEEAILMYTSSFTNNPLNLVRVVKHCLLMEQKAIAQAENGPMNCDVVTQSAAHRHIIHTLDSIQRWTQETENDLKILQEKQESFILQYQDNLKLQGQLQSLVNSHPNNQQKLEKEQQLRRQKGSVEAQLSQMAQELLQLRLALANKHKTSFDKLGEVQKKVIDEELIDWKKRQQRAGNGAPSEGNLDNLQQWCENLAELLWQNRQQLKKVEMLRAQLPIDIPAGQEDLIPGLDVTITGLLSTLVTSTFIVETQPPQVLKKDSRFSATVRLLVGGKLNVHMNPPQVEASIISETQARGLLQNDHKSTSTRKESSGQILNFQGTMEYQTTSGQLSITFRNMQLKKIKRADRRGSEVHAVTEEKFCILFQSSFDLGGGELKFQVWTLSLPVVVTVHGNQECNALATIMWDNAFAEAGRTPFHVPPTVPWHMLADMLNCKFKSYVGRDLTRGNLNYLASKVFGGNVNEDFSNRMITWTQFNKDQISGRSFTFWEWFYAILKLSKDHLKEAWLDGCIIGFIGKAQAQELLMSKENKTFLLRFSDSEIGGITIAWVAEDPNKPGENVRQVWNLAPYTTKDFAIRGLADRIKDLQTLVYLYPNTHKDEAFGKYYTPLESTVGKCGEGYVRHGIENRIPDFLGGATPMNGENPQTPRPMNPLSPDIEYGSPPPSIGSYMPNSHMDTIEESLTGLTDYNPDDIDQINVNELLARTSNSLQDSDLDMETLSYMQH